MGGISKYGAVATKIRGMRARLLTTDEYSRLASSGSVREIATYLKSHKSYAKALADVNPDEIRRAVFERLLVKSTLDDMAGISHFLDKKQRDFFSTYYTYFELRFLNDKIREIFNQYADPVDLSIYEGLYGDSKNFDFSRVLGANTIDELIEALDGSDYQEPIKRTRDMVEDAKVFEYETAVNHFLFFNFWKHVQELGSNEDKEALLDVHGSEMDMLNIIWVYRTKAYFQVEGRDMYKYLIPAYHKLKYKQLVDLVNAESVDEFMAMLGNTPYARYFDLSDPSSLERAYAGIVQKKNDKNRVKNPYSFAVIEAYIFDKRTEVNRLVRIAESVRYGYDSRLILEGLNIGGNK